MRGKDLTETAEDSIGLGDLENVRNAKLTVCRLCGKKESIGDGYVLCLQCMEDSVKNK